MARNKKRPKADTRTIPTTDEVSTPPKIVGGLLRGRKLEYQGDERTRPMKQRVRESVFNLVGPSVRETYAIDLFAGTGALGLEAISRGAAHALCIERHFPTADIIEKNAASLGVAEQCTVLGGDTFHWARDLSALPETPWTVFCSPPYELFETELDQMLWLIGGLLEASPAGSIFVVEADERFDMQRLPSPEAWDIRIYLPAHVAILKT